MTQLGRRFNLSFIFLTILTLGTLLMITGITHESLWYDESYTAAAVTHSFGDIIRITAGDSHPPLYFLMLHAFQWLFGTSVLALRLFSVIGAVGLAALGMGPVRKALGDRTAILYTLLVFIAPITLSMSQEARMYTWSAFWVTGSALYGYLAYRDNKIKDWVLMGLFTLAAAYTHYYALLAVIKKPFPFLWVALAITMGYLPWLIQLMNQVGRVSSNFWIPPVTMDVIRKVLTYPFGDKFMSSFSSSFATPAFIIAMYLIIQGIIKRIKQKDETLRVPILAFGSYFLTIVAGVVASILIRPVLVERYMMPVLGLFILVLAYGIASYKKRLHVIIACAVLILFSVPQIYYVQTAQLNGPMNEIAKDLSPKLQPGDIFLHIDEHTFGTFEYYFPGYQQYYYQRKGYEGFSSFEAFLPNGHTISDISEISKIEGVHRIWLAQRFYASDVISAKEWLSGGDLVQEGSPATYQLPDSWYGVTLYETTLGTEATKAASRTLPVGNGSLTADITGLANDDGQVLVLLYDKEPMTQDPLMSKTVAIKGGKAQAIFEKLPYGDYGIAVYHDANSNDKPDFDSKGVPKEGLGFSNNNAIPTGPPVFESTKERFDASHMQFNIPVFYMK
jgi:uncharacterized protein (DUF2141 family)/4-amino-4-deoxy-L-arabinose transferase-like glycosyltransferase